MEDQLLVSNNGKKEVFTSKNILHLYFTINGKEFTVSMSIKSLKSAICFNALHNLEP